MRANIVIGAWVCALALAPPAGAFVWRTEVDGGSNRDDHAIAVAVDAGGNVVAAGDANPSGALAELAVSKLDGASGVVLWRVGVAGTGSAFDSGAEAVALGAAGDVYAAGTLDMRGSYQDFAVVKLDGETGAVLWQTTLNGGPFDNERANALALDGRGGVIAGGYIVRAGATGQVLGRVSLNGTDNWFDVAFDVVVAGDAIVAAGWFVNGSTGSDFAAVRLR